MAYDWENLEDLTTTDWICPGACIEDEDWEWEPVFQEEGNEESSLIGKRRKRKPY